MEYCLIIFDAEFNNTAERDRAARYLAEDTRPEWGDDYPDEDEVIFEAVDDCVFPLKIEAKGKTGLRWICSGGEDDDIPAEWPERLHAVSGTTIMCICAEGENDWQVFHFDGTATHMAYVTRFYDDRERDQPIEDFEQKLMPTGWEQAMFDCDDEALLALADTLTDAWGHALKDGNLPR
ncbi:MAG: hypothetical protein KBT77_09150 [Thalassolituus oleivorans]|uniref:hypothetical protein n=1 Tax=Thalassolituus oleivorans TaxID=187493 RepID=UPI001B653F2B|nr:hypothetical protein [Thalassolituus oleivorans]MBQ0727499.1 hypothetical protein [Thalassolituus oleivorans]